MWQIESKGLEKFITHNGGFFPTVRTFESHWKPTLPHILTLYPSISQEKWRIPQLGSVETFRSNSELDFLRMISEDAAIYWDLLSAPREHVALKLQILTKGVQPLQHGRTKRGSKQQQREYSKSTDISDIREVLITASLPGNSSSTSCNSSAPAHETLIDGTVAGQWRQNTAWIHSLHEWKGEVGITPVAYRCQTYRVLYISILRPHRECHIYIILYMYISVHIIMPTIRHFLGISLSMISSRDITSDICHVLGCVSCPSGGTWPCSSHHSLSICRIKAFCHSLIHWLKIEIIDTWWHL